MDRLSDLTGAGRRRLGPRGIRRGLAVVLLAVVGVGLGCEERKAEKPTSRYASVKRSSPAEAAAASFCDQTFTDRRFAAPPERPLPAAAAAAGGPAATGGWTWVNLWATWCGPCLEEMPLLERWHKALEADGVKLQLDLWSVDEEPEALSTHLAENRLPGRVRWLAEDRLPDFLESLGVDRGAAIPVHALVDPKGKLRCVRVGKVSEGAWGQVRSILKE
jgi:thiol-disulfide isomerase/thioredoxin